MHCTPSDAIRDSREFLLNYCPRGICAPTRTFGYATGDDRGWEPRIDLARDISIGQSSPYNGQMANPNPLAGVVPQVVHPVNDGESAISEYVEKIEGEVALDTYVKAQTSAPEVVKRITELENCLQRLASAVLTWSDANKNPELRAAAREAKLLLKNRLEVDESKHRFHSELEVSKDELRILKD